MKKALFLTIGLLAVGLTSACESERSVFGEEKKAPDEFAVYSRAPLSLPPDFGLKPPRPGATRPQVVAPRNDARKALLGNSTQSATTGQEQKNLTPGITALLKNAGADQVEPDIRAVVNRETFLLSGGGDEKFVDSILFWRQQQGFKGAAIDPDLEQRRLRVKKSRAEAVTDETPTIQRSGSGGSERNADKGFWGSLFD